jgi:hypothetical protein
LEGTGRCGEVESGLEKGWPEMGMRGRRRLAAAAVVRGEWIQSERIEGGARLGFTYVSFGLERFGPKFSL